MGPILKTKLFIPSHKQSLFMLVFEEILITSYNVIPIMGPTSEENTCEIKFKYMTKKNAGPSSMSVDTKLAKRLVRENLHILKEKNCGIKKFNTVKQVIDLDNENLSMNSKLVNMVDLTKSEPEIIILDDSVHQLDKTSEFVNEVSVIDLDKTPTFSGLKSTQSEVEVLGVKSCRRGRSRSKRRGRSQSKRRGRSQSDVSISSTVSGSEIKVLRSTFKSKPKRFASNSSSGSSLVVHDRPVSRPTKRVKRKGTPTQKKPIEQLVSPTSSTRSRRKKHNVGNTRSPLRSIPTPIPQSKTLSDGVLKYYKGIAGVLNKRCKKSPSNKTLSCKQLIENRVRTRSPLKKINTKEPQEAMKQNKVTHRLPESIPMSCTKPYHRCHHKTRIIGESNIFNPNPLVIDMEGLRPIVIDGSNVAVQHGKGTFSVKGVKICTDYFVNRGHREVKVFLPQYRQEHFSEDLLQELREKCDIVFTPSRCINGVRKTSYDDRFIVQYAVEFGGVIVSTDNYRDLLKENQRWRQTINERLLMFTWVDDLLMFPVDPLGRTGPTLEQFLRF